MIGVKEQEREVPVPTIPRTFEHYKQVFPLAFESTGRETLASRKVLAIGPHLSDVALQEGVIAIDASFANVHEMWTNYRAELYRNTLVDLHEIRGIYEYLTRQDRLSNSHFVAARPHPDYGLPFPPNIFDHIVSESYIFGKLELQYNPDQIYSIILNILEHLRIGGRLHLFPYFTTRPNVVWPDPGSADPDRSLKVKPYRERYEKAYNNQQVVVGQFKKDNFNITILNTRYRARKSPRVLKTLIIDKP